MFTFNSLCVEVEPNEFLDVEWWWEASRRVLCMRLCSCGSRYALALMLDSAACLYVCLFEPLFSSLRSLVCQARLLHSFLCLSAAGLLLFSSLSAILTVWGSSVFRPLTWNYWYLFLRKPLQALSRKRSSCHLHVGTRCTAHWSSHTRVEKLHLTTSLKRIDQNHLENMSKRCISPISGKPIRKCFMKISLIW